MLYKTSQLANSQETLLRHQNLYEFAATVEILQCNTVLSNRIVIINPINKYHIVICTYYARQLRGYYFVE